MRSRVRLRGCGTYGERQRGRDMRRIGANLAALTLLSLTAGLVTSIAATWGLSACGERQNWTVRDLGPWLWPPPEGAEERPLVTSRASRWVAEREATGTVAGRGLDGAEQWRTLAQYELVAGWPRPALRRVIERETGERPVYEEPPRGLREGLNIQFFASMLGVPEGRHLPVVPMLRGFVVNGLLFSALCLPVVALLRAVFGSVVKCAWSREERSRVWSRWEESLIGATRVRMSEAIALISLLARGARAGWRPRWWTVAAWLALGGVGAVASAWLCAVVIVPRPIELRQVGGWESKHEGQRAVVRENGVELSLIERGIGKRVYERPGGWRWVEVDGVRSVQAGWPIGTLKWVHVELSGVRPPASVPSGWETGMVLRKQMGAGGGLFDREWRLPLMPMWSGLVMNFLFWTLAASLAWVPLWGVRSVRRVRRRQCPWCAYPIETGPVCVECGSEMRREGDNARAVVMRQRSAEG